MGFFEAIKKNITQGGVDVRLAAPPTAQTNTPYNFVVNITASGEPRLIQRVTANIYRTERNSINNRTQTAGERERGAAVMIASAESTESFNLSPGETRQVPFSLVLNGADMSALPGVAGSIATVFQKMGQFVGRPNYIYTLRVEADVEGIVLDPGADQRIQVMEASSMPQPTV